MIVFAHLLNDRSGSPRVLCSAIAALQRTEDKLHLFVGSDGSGCLDDLDIKTTKYWYWRTPYRILTLFTYLLSQLALFIRLARSSFIDKNAVIYVNTLLPFGAAIFGRLTGRPVIYHLHEVSVSPAPLRWFLMTIARRTASALIYVSDFHRSCLPIAGVPSVTVHNALDDIFLQRALISQYLYREDGFFNVLMLASLRDYKGIPEFINLARSLENRSDIRFHLVANDDEAAIERYFTNFTLPDNVKVHPRTGDPGLYYQHAGIVLNLSPPDKWVETFGLTLLEAMAFGVPVIAPPVGGPLEVVADGYEGFCVDSRNAEELRAKLLQFVDNEALARQFSAAARQKALLFSTDVFAESLQKLFLITNGKKES